MKLQRVEAGYIPDVAFWFDLRHTQLMQGD
jgi:hypothetical protein